MSYNRVIEESQHPETRVSGRITQGSGVDLESL